MSALVDSLHEVFEGFGRIQTRRMFGGHGVYYDGRIFALVINDTLYLKADAQGAAPFDALQLPPFAYRRGDRTVALSYRQAPAEIFEDRSEALLWARRAFEAALRSGDPPKPPTRRAAKSAKSAKTVTKKSLPRS